MPTRESVLRIGPLFLSPFVATQLGACLPEYVNDELPELEPLADDAPPDEAPPDDWSVDEARRIAPPFVVPENPPDCVMSEGRMTCDLTGSTHVYGTANFDMTLVNRTGVTMQIDAVLATMAAPRRTSEFSVSVSIDDPTTPGRGEVGCSHKRPGEAYPAVVWRPEGGSTGVIVEPNVHVNLSSNTEAANGRQKVGHAFTVAASVLNAGITAYRQPRLDKIFKCTGAEQRTVWAPWPNTTGRTLHVSGATVYSVTRGPTIGETLAVDKACVMVLATGGKKIRDQRCRGVTHRGVRALDLTVEPGEYLAARAYNTCPVGDHWDWVAYLQVY